MPPIRTVLALTDSQWAELREVNALLAKITETHSHMCECELCRARGLTDVQDLESRVIWALVGDE